MAAKRTDQTNATPGFAIQIKDDTELGLAVLVAEFGDGEYEIIGVVVSINEAREIADSNMQHRMRTMERGGDAACPECYKVFAQGIGGGYILAKEISTI